MSDLLPRPPANVEPYVEALGTDLAIEFLLAFGGSEIYITEDPKTRGRVTALLGVKNARRLGAVRDRLQRRVPLANPWMAATLHAQGLPKQEIARRLRVSDVTVRSYLRSWDRAFAPHRPSEDIRQLKLF